MAKAIAPKAKAWQVLSLVYDEYAHHAVIRLGYFASLREVCEYMAFVEPDGTFLLSKRDYARVNTWREVNGVSEDVEPLFRATLPKAQALVLLKG